MYTAFHLRFKNRKLIPEFKIFIEKILKPANVNLIILEIDKSFVFERHPEIDGGPDALTKEDAKNLSNFANTLDIEIVPLMQCLGHQGWGGSRSALLEAYPEFDETPDTPLEAEWPEIFSRSWCPQHPDVNEIVFDLMDELIEGFSSNFFHIGMDEVYEIASEQCNRCRGSNRAELFSLAVNDMHKYLTEEKNMKVMMWGDRLIDAKLFGYDNWEGDTFGTYEAIDSIPKDIIIVDWHYDEREKGYPTPEYFMGHGFSVMPACWFKENVAVQLFNETKLAAEKKHTETLFFGRLITSWNNWSQEALLGFIDYPKDNLRDEENELSQLYNTIQKVGSI